MFTRILVPLDGSLRAEKALPLAAKFARAVKGTIVLVRVITTGTEYWPAPVATTNIVGGVIEDERQTAWHYLLQQASHAALNGIPVELDVRWGPVIPSVMEALTFHQCDLMLMCHKKRDGSAHPLTRNVTEQLVLHSSVPVFLLHEEGPQPLFHHLDPLQPERILVGWDGTCDPLAIFDAAVSLLVDEKELPQGAIHVAGVFPPERCINHLKEQEEMKLMVKEQLCLHIRKAHDQHGFAPEQVANVSITWSITKSADRPATLIKFAEGREASQGYGGAGRFDVIVVPSTFGDHECPEWYFGNVVNQMMQETHIPILSIPTTPREPEKTSSQTTQTPIPTP